MFSAGSLVPTRPAPAGWKTEVVPCVLRKSESGRWTVLLSSGGCGLSGESAGAGGDRHEGDHRD